MVASAIFKVMTLTMLTTLCEVQGLDLTLNPGASGMDVVNSVFDRIRSKCVFSEDRLFLRRTAYVMSHDGLDSFTYRAGFDGGIWQITESMFLATQSCSQSSIRDACGNITSGLSITWSSVQWSDLRKPLYSGLAAALSALHTLGSNQMPGDIPSQANLWASMYNKTDGDTFVQYATLTPIPQCQDKLDLAFVLESSSSVSSTDFQLMKNFTASVVDVMNVSLNAIRIADIIYASTVNVTFDFDDYTTKAAVKGGLLSAAKLGTGTNTAAALDQARALYNSSLYGARTDAKRVTVLVTDGISDSLYATRHAARNLKSVVTVFAVGVGDYNLTELQAVASHPVCSHVLTLTGFDKIDSIIDEIQQSACKANHIGHVENSVAIDITIETPVPPPNKALEATVSCGILHIYVSVTERKPSVAVYDELYIATPERPAVLTIVDSLPEGNRVYVTVIGTPMHYAATSFNNCTDYRWSLQPTFKNSVNVVCEENGARRTCSDEDINDAGLCHTRNSTMRVRLVNGTTPREGRLEVSLDGQTWGTVCDDYFSTLNAGVVCNMLGYNVTNPQYRSSGFFGMGSSGQSILLDNVQCTGRESNLLDCQHNPIGVNDCSHIEDVSVVCGTVNGSSVVRARLVGGTTPREGRLEVSVDGQTWGTVCDDGFSTMNAQVVCNMLGYNATYAQYHSSGFFGVGNSTQPILLENVICMGLESSLFDCYHSPIGVNNCNHSNDVGVVCKTVNGSSVMRARLVNGTTPREGRLEVSLDGQTWGTVCDDGFSTTNAHVVCNMLGYNSTNPQYYLSTRYGAGNSTQPILLDDVRCTGRESNLLDCQHNPIGVNDCNHMEDVGVICDNVNGSSVMGARLVGGTTPTEGRLEVSMDGQTWGTVCDDRFSTINARVVCNMLGYNATNPQYHSNGFFGAGNWTQPILLDDVQCAGWESNLLDCQHNPIGVNDCSHMEDVGVTCDTVNGSSVVRARLVGGTTPREGRLEVSVDGQTWGTVCDNGFSTMNAYVVCNMLGYNATYAQYHSSGFFGVGNSTQPILLENVICMGLESSLFDCYHSPIGVNNCNHSNDVGVVCGTVNGSSVMRARLVGGTTPTEGRLEVSVDGQTWGTVCDDRFSTINARVVCNMLGYNATNPQYHSNGFFGAGNWTQPILLDNVQCTGWESNLLDCQHNPIGVNDCSHMEDVGVTCDTVNGSSVMRARLVGGTTPMEGRLEVSVDGQTWGTVCDDIFSTINARVVCNMLGYNATNPQFHSNGFFGAGNWTQPILLDNVQCAGWESNLLDCQHNPIGVNDCSHREDVGVTCDTVNVSSEMKARLVGGSSPTEGRLEVSLDGQMWGTVCDDHFSIMNAHVVCTMLGYNGTNPQYYFSTRYGAGNSTQPILLDDVRCTGTESNLLDCQHNPIGVHNCGHGEDVGVTCDTASGGGQLRARLMNGTSNSNGRLEIQLNGGNWSTVCDDSFDTPEAEVACRMLGFNSSNPVVVSSSMYGAGNGSIILDDLQCTGTELSLSQCGSGGYYSHNCNHYEDVGLQCIPASGEGQLRARLMNGTSNSNGRLEIQLNGGNWSTVCDDSFGTPDAEVACRMLGFNSSNPVVVPWSMYGAGNGSIILDDLQCTGTELSLSQCGSRGYYSHNCNHYDDVGLQCIPGA